MSKVSKTQKTIIEAHLKASIKDDFDISCPKVGEHGLNNLNDLKNALEDGKTIHQLHKIIEQNHVSITSQLMATPSLMGHISEAYKKSYTRGFKDLLTRLNIN